jgi:hypothetical protein
MCSTIQLASTITTHNILRMILVGLMMILLSSWLLIAHTSLTPNILHTSIRLHRASSHATTSTIYWILILGGVHAMMMASSHVLLRMSSWIVLMLLII